MVVQEDRKFMQMALDLASKARGKTSPNPMVGAVIVKNGKIVGRGYHKKAGQPHAEINAIKDAGSMVEGATLYINLEPCCHHGKTGPCTTAIIKSKIKRVVFAHNDPNPIVAGKGAAKLRKAGIEVKSGIMKKEARALNEIYIKFITTGRPFVILKTAQTIDGRIATTSGDSKWITNEKSRKQVHQLRAECDAILVGSTTIRKDNPELTVRHVRGENPYRIILTGTAQCKKSMNVLKENQDMKTVVATSAHTAKYLRKYPGLIIWEIKKVRDGLSITDLLDKAAAFGISSILLEGGPTLASEFIAQGLVDKHYAFIAPKMIGNGQNVISGLATKKMADCIHYNDVELITDYYPDILMVGYPYKGKK